MKPQLSRLNEEQTPSTNMEDSFQVDTFYSDIEMRLSSSQINPSAAHLQRGTYNSNEGYADDSDYQEFLYRLDSMDYPNRQKSTDSGGGGWGGNSSLFLTSKSSLLLQQQQQFQSQQQGSSHAADGDEQIS
jgi:hypothetical protein